MALPLELGRQTDLPKRRPSVRAVPPDKKSKTNRPAYSSSISSFASMSSPPRSSKSSSLSSSPMPPSSSGSTPLLCTTSSSIASFVFNSKSLNRFRKLPSSFQFVVYVSIIVALVSLFTTWCPTDSKSRWLCSGFAGSLLENTSLCLVINGRSNSDVIGGWRPASPEIWAKYGTAKCSIERISVTDITPERFESEYRFKRPVIVTFPNGASDWTTPADWSREGLTKKYSDWTIRSDESLEIVRKGGNAQHASSFVDYVENLLMQEGDYNSTAEPRHYACDREFFALSRLGSSLRLPMYFEINTTEDESIFFLGPSTSGVVFHKHSDTWNGVIYGHKRWFLYPNTRTPPGGVYHGYSLLKWVTHVYPNLTEEEKPMECIQQPGEILYLAEGTYHATLNLGDTVAVAIQKRKATILAEKLSYEATIVVNHLQSKEEVDPKSVFLQRLLEIYEEWHKLLPESSEAVLKAGSTLFDMKKFEEALVWQRKAIEMDPYFIYAYLHLAKTLTELRQYEEAEVNFKIALALSPDLWDTYKEYGEFLQKMGRYRDALPVYKKGTELQPGMIPFWFYYKFCQVHVGDLEGAEATEMIIQRIKAEQSQM